MKKKISTRRLVVAALLTAIILALGWPGSPLNVLGYPPMPVFNATTLHIPVILGGVLQGPLMGAFYGLVFGLTSLLSAILRPTSPLSPVFVNPLVSVLPRILMGWLTGLIFMALCRKKPNRAALWAALTGVLGAFINAALVLPAAYLESSELFLQYLVPEAKSLMIGLFILMGTNTVPEAVFSGILVPAIYAPLRKLFPHMVRTYQKKNEAINP